MMDALLTLEQTPWQRFRSRAASWRFISILSTAVIVIAVVIATPQDLPFWLFAVSDITNQLLLLFLVALFIERCVEVIMGTWRGKDKRQLQAQLNVQKRRLRDATGPVDDALNAAKNAEMFSAETHVLALLTALFLGIVISALGIRILQPLVDPVAFKALTGWQRSLFTGADVFITGAMLGGGSEGIHKITDAFLSQFDRWRIYTKEKTR